MYPAAQMAAVLGITDLFTLAQQLAARHASEQGELPVLQVTHWYLDENTGMLQREGSELITQQKTPHFLIIPPSLDQPISEQVAKPYVEGLIALHQAGTLLVSICAGAFLLAETGMLNGRTITTHWLYEEKFSLRFPQVQVDVDQLIIDGDDIITAGGLMSWTDLGLRIVDRYLGAATMIDTGNMLLVDPPGRQQRYYSSFSPRLAHGDEAILQVQHWFKEHGRESLNLAQMAQQAQMEERTFLRRFRKATGMTATDYLQRLRVDWAREKLQFTTSPIETIAWEVGYSDPGSFRKVFTRIVGLTPSEYRRRFHT